MAWYDDAPSTKASNNPIGFSARSSTTPRGKTHPVGTKQPNNFGLYDMLGNVKEWCEDKFNNVFYSESVGSRDPVCTEGWQGVFRGGSWGDTYESCRSAQRDGWRTDESRDPVLGFRACYYPLP